MQNILTFIAILISCLLVYSFIYKIYRNHECKKDRHGSYVFEEAMLCDNCGKKLK